MNTTKVIVPFAILVVLVLLGFLFVTYNKSAKKMNAEMFSEYDISDGIPEYNDPISVADNATANPSNASGPFGGIGGSDPHGNEVFNPVKSGDSSDATVPAPSCYPRDRLSAEDLLPTDAANSKWAKMNPMGQGDVKDQNFLTAGYHIGINTSVGRNNSLDIRHEPMAPQIPVSPWGISTIVPQQKTNGLYDIGSGCLNE